MVVKSKHSIGGDYIKTQDTVLKWRHSRQGTLEHSSWEDYIKNRTGYLHYYTVDKAVALEYSNWNDYIKTQDKVFIGRHSRQGGYFKTQYLGRLY